MFIYRAVKLVLGAAARVESGCGSLEMFGPPHQTYKIFGRLAAVWLISMFHWKTMKYEARGKCKARENLPLLKLIMDHIFFTLILMYKEWPIRDD